MTSRRPIVVAVALTVTLANAACGGDDPPTSEATTEATTEASDAAVIEITDEEAAELDFPEILMVEPSQGDDGLWTFAVTIASPYDTPQQYADGWRVMGADGTVYGVHTLGHDHANEQPFTRTQLGVEIPDEITEVTVEGRDLVNGFGGPTLTVDLDRG